MGLLIGLLVAAVAVVGLSAGAVAFGRAGSNAEIRKRLAAGGMTPEQGEALRDAQRSLHASRTLLYGIRDPQLREQASHALEKADGLVDALRNQPEEIRRNNQFFSYYVPTLNAVLSKYETLERAGTLQDDELLEKTRGHMQDMAHAFDLMHDNMYKDEALDLDVEIEAMKMALKREGLS